MLAANLNAYAEKALGSQDLRPQLEIDAEIVLGELTDDLLHWVSALEPFGMANPSPVFLSRNVQVLHARNMGNSGQHVALNVRQGDSEWKALAFNLGERWQGERRAGETTYLDLVYTLTADHWRGPEALALRILDFRPAAG